MFSRNNLPLHFNFLKRLEIYKQIKYFKIKRIPLDLIKYNYLLHKNHESNLRFHFYIFIAISFHVQ